MATGSASLRPYGLPLPDTVPISRYVHRIAGSRRRGRRSRLRHQFGAVVIEAVLHLEADRATKGVEAEGRIVGPDIRAADRHLRNQVPVDGIPEGLIDADTLHVDGEPLRRALQRRCREAPVA